MCEASREELGHHGAMSTRREREEAAELSPTTIWALPTEKDAFLRWLKEHGLTLEAFRELPAWKNAPPELVASLR